MKKMMICLLLFGFIHAINSADVQQAFRVTTGSLNKEKKLVIENAESGSPDARFRAIRICGWLRLYACYRVLLKALEDPDPVIRKESAESISLLKLPDSAEPLEKRLKEEKDDTVKSSIIVAIGFTGRKDKSKMIESYLTAENTSIRRHAAQALGLLGNKDTIPALNKALDSETKEHLKPVILRSLIILAPENTEYLNAIIAELFVEDEWARYYAAEAIKDLKLKEAISALEKSINLEAIDLVREQMYDAYLAATYGE